MTPIEQARAALAACTDTDRRALFKEFGVCACASLVKAAVESPAATLGAALGAVAGGILGAALEKTKVPK